MTRTVDDLEAQLLSLSEAERSHLLEKLILSLDVDQQLQRAWIDEAHRRDAEIESGAVKLSSGEEAVARIRAGLA